ncbi:MAG: hypothetical protein QNJ68_02810 [Microcoleaceae cyanobacterium MO_207.B10]|nr:hypothetical protein [Microcoleaceae cyanobacterium MO_207.B10]
MSLSKLAYKLGYQLGKAYAKIKHTIKLAWQCWCNPPQTDSFAMELLAR